MDSGQFIEKNINENELVGESRSKMDIHNL